VAKKVAVTRHSDRKLKFKNTENQVARRDPRPGHIQKAFKTRRTKIDEGTLEEIHTREQVWWMFFLENREKKREGCI